MNAGETVQSTAMLDMDPWTWCGGLGGNPGTATHQLCPSFNPHEPSPLTLMSLSCLSVLLPTVV